MAGSRRGPSHKAGAVQRGMRFPRGWMGRAELHPSRRRQLWAGRGGCVGPAAAPWLCPSPSPCLPLPPPTGEVPPTNPRLQPCQSLTPLLALPGLPIIILVPAGLCCSWTPGLGLERSTRKAILRQQPQPARPNKAPLSAGRPRSPWARIAQHGVSRKLIPGWGERVNEC